MDVSQRDEHQSAVFLQRRQVWHNVGQWIIINVETQKVNNCHNIYDAMQVNR